MVLLLVAAASCSEQDLPIMKTDVCKGEVVEYSPLETRVIFKILEVPLSDSNPKLYLENLEKMYTFSLKKNPSVALEKEITFVLFS